jgi:hypothetical protein
VIRRADIVVAFVIFGAVVVAGMVVIALQVSVPQAVVVGLVSGVLGSSSTAVATLLAVRWTMQGQRERDQAAHIAARRAEAIDRQRAAFRHLLVAAAHITDAATEMRMYPWRDHPAWQSLNREANSTTVRH